MQECDSLILPRWLAPVEPAGAVLEGHAVALRDGCILALAPAAEARARFRARSVIERPGHLLIPGLVNAHTHAAMTLFRGMADDLPLERWLGEHIWPAEGRWADAEMVRDGTRLAVAEMLRGGVTAFSDMYFFPDVVAETAAAHGMRAVVGLIVLEAPTVWAGDAEEYLERGLAVREALAGEPLVECALAPHAPYTVGDAALGRVAELAGELGLRVHMHVHETAAEVERAVAGNGERPLARLARLGLLNERLIAVHMTQLEPPEIGRVAGAGAAVVHCPESNLKLASGFAPAAALAAAGVTLALGTDGAASNNDLDLLGEMRTAALLAKGVAGDATALPAHECLRMATLGGARALGLGARIGSIVPGKEADLACVALDAARLRPVHDPVSQLVYAANAGDVSDTWVAGRRLLADGRLTTVDRQAVVERAEEWRERIAGGDHAAADALAAGEPA